MKFLDSGFAVSWSGMRLLRPRHTRFAILPASWLRGRRCGRGAGGTCAVGVRRSRTRRQAAACEIGHLAWARARSAGSAAPRRTERRGAPPSVVCQPIPALLGILVSHRPRFHDPETQMNDDYFIELHLVS